MFYPLDKLEQDFLFEDEDRNVYSLSRRFLDELAADLKLKYLATIIEGDSFKEVYYDADHNVIVFKCAISCVDIKLENAIVSLSCIAVDKDVEVYETAKSLKSYWLNIRSLLERYIRNEKIFGVAERVYKDFEQKQSYIA